MLFEPSVEALVKKVGNTYILANLLAKRAKEIVLNPTEELLSGEKKELQIAAEEILAGKVVVDDSDNRK